MPAGQRRSSVPHLRSAEAAGVVPDESSLAAAGSRGDRHARRLLADTGQRLRLLGRCPELPRQSLLPRSRLESAPLDVHHLPRGPLHPPDLALPRPRLPPLGFASRRLPPHQPPPPHRHRAHVLLPRPPSAPPGPASRHLLHRPPLGRRPRRPRLRRPSPARRVCRLGHRAPRRALRPLLRPRPALLRQGRHRHPRRPGCAPPPPLVRPVSRVLHRRSPLQIHRRHPARHPPRPRRLPAPPPRRPRRLAHLPPLAREASLLRPERRRRPRRLPRPAAPRQHAVPPRHAAAPSAPRIRPWPALL